MSMKIKRLEKTLDGRELTVLSNSQYNKWEKSHIDDLLPRQELETLKKFDAVYKSWPLWKRMIYSKKRFVKAILSRFHIWRMGKYRGKR